MLVPAEEHAVGHGFDVHGRGLDRRAIIRLVFDDFFMKALVLAPAGHDKSLGETVGKTGNMEIAVNGFRRVGIIRSLLKTFADHELQELNLVAHGRDYKGPAAEAQA